MTETVDKNATGAILYDKQIINQMTAERFSGSGWLHAEAVTGELNSAGRGSTLYVGNIPKQFVLRHYLRGGLVGRVVRDHYLFTGEDRTRPFCEWRLLAKLSSNGLRVPRPAAARYCRRGLLYTADIITVRIPNVTSLSQYITGTTRDEPFWQALGRSIFDFHRAGVCHADMNAHNLQIDDDGELWMLDFDRGELKAPGPWQQQTLARLRRSLDKIRGLSTGVNFAESQWQSLLEGYFNASRSA